MSIFKGNVILDIPNLRPNFLITPQIEKIMALIGLISESEFRLLVPYKLSVRLTCFFVYR